MKKVFLYLISFVLCFGCNMLPTTMIMSNREPPPKLDVVSWDFGTMTDRLGVFIWVEQPVWGPPTSIHVSSNMAYPYYTSRHTSNRPMMRVFIDQTIVGKECRWETKALEQSHRTKQASDFNFGNGVKISSEDGHGSGQSSTDCEKIKAMIVNDPRYKSKMSK